MNLAIVAPGMSGCSSDEGPLKLARQSALVSAGSLHHPVLPSPVDAD